jgi:opacity protein-like surface antigen
MDLIKEAKMRKALTAAMAAITLGGAVCATAAPAEAQHYRGGGGYHGGYYGGHRGHGDGAAVAAGVLGLALGAAIASDHGYSHSYYDRGYGGGYGYYGGPAYGYDYPAYRTCVTTRWVWDPYIGRRVPVRQSYAC